MSVVLVNGDGNPAVHASQDADLLGGIGGQETGILDINDKFAATIADANTVEISSGVCITKEGRRIQIDVGDVEEIVVPTGSQGTTKYYIIGFHLYTDGSGNQLAETFIDEVASPSATITEKMFKDGETEVYVSLYRITRNGLNLEGLTLILPEIGSLAGGGIIGNTDISGIADGTVTGAIAQINTDLSVKYNSSDDYIYMLLNGTWKKWHKAYLQNLYIFTSDGFADGFGIGEGQRYDSSYTLYGSMTQEASALVCTCKTSEQAYSCITLLSQTVDLTNYSTVNATFVANGGTYNVSVDVESLEGEHYIGLGYREGKYSYPHLSLDIKNVMGTYTVDGRVAGASAAMGAYITNSFTITRIWCE